MSNNTNSIGNEIFVTKDAFKMFSTWKYNPIVKIYEEGMVRYNKNNYYYYLMENLEDDYIELHKLIKLVCLKKSDKTFDMKKIFLNIFKVLKKMKTHNLSHCDLHTKNIFIHTKNQSIKIIDFGVAENICKKRRVLSKSILDSYKICNITPGVIAPYVELLEGEMLNRELDSDLSMFVSIVGIFYKKKMIIKKLYNLSAKIFVTQELKQRIKLLDEYEDYLNELLSE